MGYEISHALRDMEKCEKIDEEEKEMQIEDYGKLKANCRGLAKKWREKADTAIRLGSTNMAHNLYDCADELEEAVDR